MTPAAEDRYRRLELESSNLLMEWDGLAVLGRQDEAARAVIRAGRGREQMAQIRLEAGDLPGAAEDWLSASECFLQAASLPEAREALERILDQAARGGALDDRADLLQALGDRLQEIERLRKTTAALDGSVSHPKIEPGVPDERAKTKRRGA